MTTRRRGERGETLVELLITIMIIGTAVVAILAGIAVASNSSDEHKKQVGVVVVLRDYAEAVMNAPYQGCNYPINDSSYTPSGYAPPAPYNASITAVASYDGASSAPAAFNTCPATDTGAVRITIEAHSTDNRASRTLQIVKAADYARPS